MKRSSLDSSERLVFWPEMDRLPSPLSAPITAQRDALHLRLRQAIDAALTPKQREVVLLYYFKGQSERDIAGALGVSQQVVHKRLHGARRGQRQVGGALKRLREALGPLRS